MSSRRCTLSTTTSIWQSKDKQKKHKYYKCIHQYQHDNQQSTSFVNAYINTQSILHPTTHNMITHRHLHTHTHPSIHIHAYTHAYTRTHARTHTHKQTNKQNKMPDHTTRDTHTRVHTHTQNKQKKPDHTTHDTHTHTHTHQQKDAWPHHSRHSHNTHTHAPLHTHTHNPSHPYTHTHTEQAFLLVLCFATTTTPGVSLRVRGEGSAEEVCFEAGFKTCGRCKERGLYQNKVPYIKHLIFERPYTSTFQVNVWDREQFVRSRLTGSAEIAWGETV